MKISDNIEKIAILDNFIFADIIQLQKLAYGQMRTFSMFAGGHQCNVAGDKQVLPALLGWYNFFCCSSKLKVCKFKFVSYGQRKKNERFTHLDLILVAFRSQKKKKKDFISVRNRVKLISSITPHLWIGTQLRVGNWGNLNQSNPYNTIK